MRLWLLFPIDPTAKGSAWRPWYDKCFRMVVRAESEAEARQLADSKASDENRDDRHPWTDPEQSTCKELLADGAAEVVLKDVHHA